MKPFYKFTDTLFAIGVRLVTTMQRSIFFSVAIAVSYVLPVAADTQFVVKNESGANRTLSDLIGYSGDNITGNSETKLIKGDSKNDPNDDINIATGGMKIFTFTGLKRSFTISWLDKNGKEIETDIVNALEYTLTENLFAFFDRNDGGDFAVSYSGNGILPDGSFPVSNGKISGFDQITFYDVGPDGFIQRDSLGNPISPLLDGVSVTTEFRYSILTAVPEPSTLTLMVFGFAVGYFGMRKAITR